MDVQFPHQSGPVGVNGLDGQVKHFGHLAVGVAVGDEVIGQLIDVIAGAFLDSARGEALDRLVFDRYGLLRKQAASSLGTVNFITTTPTASSFTIPEGTVVSGAISPVTV